ATLKFFADDGSPLALPLTFPQGASAITSAAYTQTIPAGGSLWVQSTGSAAAALQTGSAQLATTDNVSGYEIFRYNVNGQEAVVPLESRGAASYLIPFDTSNGTVTGIAIANASGQAINVPVSLLDGNSASSIPISANGHFTATLNQMF